MTLPGDDTSMLENVRSSAGPSIEQIDTDQAVHAITVLYVVLRRYTELYGNILRAVNPRGI